MSDGPAQRIANDLKEKFQGKVLAMDVPTDKRVYMSVAPSDWPEVAIYLWGDRRARFNIASGIQLNDGYEVLWHFSLNEGGEAGVGDRDGVVASVRVKADDPDKPSLPSVAGRIKAMSYIERELHDLLGIDFEGHPNLATLLRAEDWPDDFYPLRRTEKRAELDYEGTDFPK